MELVGGTMECCLPASFCSIVCSSFFSVAIVLLLDCGGLESSILVVGVLGDFCAVLLLVREVDLSSAGT